MSPKVPDLLELLDLEPLERNMFRGISRDLGGRVVFGGQVVAQALVAAARTVPLRPPHSLHAYFLRGGDHTRPIVYDVEHTRDGGNFSARRVRAVQNGESILTLMASFSTEEQGLEHQLPAPEVTAPEMLRDIGAIWSQWLDETHDQLPPHMRVLFSREWPLEIRPVNPIHPLDRGSHPPTAAYWLRLNRSLPDDPVLHRAVLAYASDFSLLTTAMLPHGRSQGMPDMLVASIDHALWFHRSFRADDWLLYTMDSPSAHHARGFSRGLIYDRAGRLVASVAQEGLIRVQAGTASPTA